MVQRSALLALDASPRKSYPHLKPDWAFTRRNTYQTFAGELREICVLLFFHYFCSLSYLHMFFASLFSLIEVGSEFRRLPISIGSRASWCACLSIGFVSAARFMASICCLLLFCSSMTTFIEYLSSSSSSQLSSCEKLKVFFFCLKSVLGFVSLSARLWFNQLFV